MNTDTYISTNSVTTYIKATDENINIVTYIQQQPIKFKQEFESMFGIPENIALLHRTKCIRITSTSDQQTNILAANSIMDLHITSSLPKVRVNHAHTPPISNTYQTNASQFKCVIRNVALTLSEEEICQLTNANNARRLTRFTRNKMHKYKHNQ